ncbi:hypothetical protein ACA910_003975 [Epithemia clementina (nom. ined.)]
MEQLFYQRLKARRVKRSKQKKKETKTTKATHLESPKPQPPQVSTTPEDDWAGDPVHELEEHWQWLDIESALLGLDDLFGTYHELLSSVSEGAYTLLKKAPDPLKQFQAIRQLNLDALLNVHGTTPSTTKHVMRCAMYAAARLACSRNLNDVTTTKSQVQAPSQFLQSL